MHAGKRYTLKEFLYWTRRDIYLLAVWTLIPMLLYHFAGWTWLAIPWVPVALIGTAAAFIVGFRNTQTYNRLWEARQIWGSIINSSRSWGMLVSDFVRDPTAPGSHSEHKVLIYRHLAWLTALRFQLREVREWENIKGKPSNLEYTRLYTIDEWVSKLEEKVKPFLSEEDYAYVMNRKNRATHIISLQSAHLRDLKNRGHIEPLNYVEMERILVDLYDHQGRCERIKNFPYPRQFATINQMFIRLFCSVIPFALLNEFSKLGENMIWLTLPFSITIAWVFLAMERVGESTENPFEGNANDVPITAMTRTIEIDLREMLGETEIPEALKPVNKILM